MKYYFTICLILLALHVKVTGQFTDNFNDGDLNGWQGDTQHFIVNPAGQLQLNAPAGSTTSWLYTPVIFIDSMVWEIYFKLDFAPSTSNQLRIYLGLTSEDLLTAQGYYLEIGATGDQDALELKYLDHGSITSIASSAPALVAAEPVELTLRVVKNGDGIWNIFKLGGTQPELLFTVQENAIPLSSLHIFGLYEKYSDTRRDKFYFDNISILPLQPDQTAPTWLSLTVVNDHSVHLIFDEILDSISSVDPSHYLLMPVNQPPSTIEYHGNELLLSWAQSFVSQQEYFLTIHTISDKAGNLLDTDSKSFTFIDIGLAAPFELLITEIMADPTPVIGLPDAEYIEIYNPTTHTFNLSNYKLRVGSTDKTLPDSLIYPGEFVIVTDDGSAAALTSFGRLIVLSSFPSLTNSGTTIAIVDNGGNVIHEVTYSLSWYHDPNKDDGGWSLEMINASLICADEDNWRASGDFKGGTPGHENSIWLQTPDVSGPELLSLFTASDNVIELRFNERIDPVLMADPGLYTFQPSISISDVQIISPKTVQLTLAAPLQAGIIYQLLPFTAYDCLGNQSTTGDTLLFGVVAAAEPGDIKINEILFNPAVGGSRFIEIINTSQKFIDLSTVAIGRLSSAHQDIYPTGVNEILAPGEIVAFSPDPNDILSRYTVPYPENLFYALLPSWDEDSDQVTLFAGGMVIDSFTYDASWHHPVISDENGVSLERISATGPTTSSSNWHSASSLSGYATPTGINSQSLNPTPGTDPFSITNQQFTPNDDGYKDFLIIDFKLPTGNEVVTATVYDLEGRVVRLLVTNEILGTNAFVQWDGRNEEDRVADMGIYILYIQIWDPAGNVKAYQQSCALVKR
jgi:hypothetical protein